MSKEFIKIREIFLQLFRKQRSLLRTAQGLPEYDKLYKDYPPMDSEDDICKLMNEDKGLVTDFCHSDEYLYLPPMDKDPKIVPIILFDCDLSTSPNDISFSLILFRFNNGSAVADCIAFRFEGPEGEPKRSRHHYWHMQVTNEILGRNGYQKIKCKDWLPVKMPCIPIVSECPVSLLLCVLFSFYGKKMYQYLPVGVVEPRHFEPLKGILADCC